MSDWFIYCCFFILGLVLGRLGACLVEFFSVLEKEKKGALSFFLQCQKEWGHLPCSWVLKKIKKKNVPVRPFILELLMGSIFVCLFYSVGWKYILLEYLIFVFALLVASAVDLEQMILPDSLTLSGIVLGLLGALLNPETGREFFPSLAGVLMGGGFLWSVAIFYYALRKEEGLGGGDIKLLAWIGAVLTWKAVPFVILLSCFTGLITGFVMMFRSKEGLQQSIPFGPYLAFSAFVYIIYGEELAHSYLSLFYML